MQKTVLVNRVMESEDLEAAALLRKIKERRDRTGVPNRFALHPAVEPSIITS